MVLPIKYKILMLVSVLIAIILVAMSLLLRVTLETEFIELHRKPAIDAFHTVVNIIEEEYGEHVSETETDNYVLNEGFHKEKSRDGKKRASQRTSEKDQKKIAEKILHNFRPVFQSFRFSWSGFILIFDDKGKILISSQEKKLPHLPPVLDVHTMETMRQISRTPEKTIEWSVSDREKAGQILIFRVMYYKPISWYIAAVIPKDSYLGTYRNICSRLAYFVLAIWFFAVMITIFISDNISTPISTLAEYARKLPGTDLFRKDTRELGFHIKSSAKEVNDLSESIIFMEEKLREQIRSKMEKEAFLSGIMDSIPFGVITFDNKGIIESQNSAFIRMMGSYVPNHSAITFHDIFDPRLCGRIEDVLKNLEMKTEVRDLSTRIFEGRLQNGNQVLFPVEVRLSVLTSFEKDLIICVLIDISERKEIEAIRSEYHENLTNQVKERTAELRAVNDRLLLQMEERTAAETALRESEERYRSIVEISPDLIVLHRNGEIIYINQAGLDLLGADTREKVIGKNVLEFVSPDFREVAMSRMKKHQDRLGEKTPFYRQRLVRLDGSTVDVELVGIPFLLDGSNVVQLIARDISEKLAMNRLLKENEERYKFIVENAEDAIFIVQNDIIKFPNPGTMRLLGYNKAQLKEIPLSEIVHREDLQIIHEIYKQKSTRIIVPANVSIRIMNQSGEEIWVELSVVQITWEGEPATMNFARDITARKQFETFAFQTRKMQSIGVLAGGIAHNFNNLLMGIQGRISLMLQKTDPTQVNYSHLKKIEQIVQNGSELTNRLLGFAGGGKYDIRETDIDELLSRILDECDLPGKNIDIHFTRQENLLKVKVDRTQIGQVLKNVLMNAFDAMQKDGHLFLETRNVELDRMSSEKTGLTPGPFVQITVQDDGIGMDENTLNRVFDPFFTTREKTRGTGLGMASAYGIIVNHGGTIDIQSTVGKGTSVNIFLPGLKNDGIDGEKTSEDSIDEKKLVLLVDDEEIVLEIGKDMLSELGFKTLCASTVSEAMALLERYRNRIELVILDVVMPGVSGMDLLKTIRDIYPKVRVLLCSGYEIKGLVDNCMKDLCVRFIQKPFTFDGLKRAIDDFSV